MPNQSLPDLTERTATADSDLIHVNSGGTDYKQTKKNFTFDLVQYHEFNNTDTLTSQCDSLATSGKSPAYYVGKINSYGHQSATGVPFNNSYHVQLSIYSASYIELTLTDVDDGGVFRKIKTGGTWQSSWTMQPTRAEISALNNSLTNSSVPINAGTSAVTITRNNSYKWGNIIVIAVRFKVTSAISIYGYVLQIPSSYRIVSDVYQPLMTSYFTTLADKGIYVDADGYTFRASSSIPTGDYTFYVPVLVRNA